MILGNELELQSVPVTGSTHPGTGARRRAPWLPVLVWLLFCAVAIALQFASGAYHSEFGGYPDEPAHYVTSLAVREYITAHVPSSPIHFAENYYRHYPKVALGHWPPLFYLLQALWMVLFSDNRASILLELAATTAFLAYAVYSEAGRWFHSVPAAVLAGLLTVALPLVQVSTAEEMAETLLILTCFWSAVFFARYAESGRWQDSAWFGLFFSFAVLTKGSAWLLVFVPPVVLLLTRKLRLLLRRSFWISAAIVAVLCIPWQILTMQMAERGWTGGTKPSVGYTLNALRQFLVIIEQALGPALTILLIVGMAVSLFRKRIHAGPAAMFALAFAVWVFHSLVPAGVEDRKMVLAVPAFVLLIFCGGFWIASHIPVRGKWPRWPYALVTALAALAFFLQTFTIPRRQHYGYIEAARFLTSQPQFHQATILAASPDLGEGLLVSEVAMREPRPSMTILRATKVLAHVDWTGSQYQSLFSTPAAVVNYLDSQGVALVVTDTYPSFTSFTHNQLLRQAIDGSHRFVELAAFHPEKNSPGEVEIYRLNPR